ncbi:MAG: hypothetical protein K0S56_214 [Microvirga sp.]|jgi:hypothetical protein|nr:hypothetical protein [Microvirga sp.]
MRWLLALVLLGVASPLLAQGTTPPDVLVRSRAEPASGAVVGQHVALSVDVLFRGEMPRPRVALPDVASLQTFRFETQGTTLRDTVEGEAYVGQRFEFALYARRGGDFTVPPAEVTLLDHDGGTVGRAQGSPVALSIAVPRGVDASQPVVATRRLTLEEQWSPTPGGAFKAGDAIVRTITRTAEDVPGLVLCDVPLATPDGVRAYGDPPSSVDRINRGVVRGQRVDRITYVFGRGGRIALPELAQPWWDLGEGALKTARGAGATIEVAAALVAASPPSARSATSPWLSMAVIAAGVALLTGLVGWVRRVVVRWRIAYAGSERKAFGDLTAACRTGDPGAIYSAFSAWRSHLLPEGREKAGKIAAPLERALFAGGGWTPATARN